MTKRYFITGTDTDIGKTYVTKELINALVVMEYKVLGLKPLALGSANDFPHKNDDAILLQEVSNVAACYEEVNPYFFQTAAAPHVAFLHERRAVDSAQIIKAIDRTLCQHKPDIALIEGAGGWRVPLTAQDNMSDVALGLTRKVIFVVGLRLGCLNHALLTLESIRASGATCAGWVINCVEQDMPYQEENIELLKAMIDAPHLGTVGYGQTHREVAFTLQPLFS